MNISPAVQKLTYWSSGFFFPFVLFFIGITFYEWFTRVDLVYTAHKPLINTFLSVITGFEVVQIAFLRFARRLTIEIEKKYRIFIIWGLLGWFFFAIALFILLPVGFVMFESFFYRDHL